MRKGNGTAFIEGVEDPGEDTDNESISTLVSERDTDNTSDDDTKGDSDYNRSDAEQGETEATNSEDSGEYDDLGSLVHEPFRYKAVMRIPWQNRKVGGTNGAFTALDARVLTSGRTMPIETLSC